MNTLDPDLRALDGYEEPAGFDVVDAADLIDRPYSPPEFLVESIIPRVGTVLLTGDTGSCKSALMIHFALCLATGAPVGGRFAVRDEPRPIVMLNGEMGSDLLRSYLFQAAAGIGIEIPRGRVLFEGANGVATFRFGYESRDALEALVDRVRPSAITFDTQRALFGLDENDTSAVRAATAWLSHLAEKYQLSTIVSHHLRKIGPVSNSDRARVAGSRDWVAGVDVHLAAKSRDGRAMHALAIGKTRTPTVDAMAGTEWPIEARLELREEPPRSIILAGDPARVAETQSLDDVVGELRARLEAEGPMTIAQMGATKGNAKRAYEDLRRRHELVEVGKDDRKTVFGLAGIHETEDDGTRTRSEVDRTRDRARRNPNNDEGLKAVKAGPHSGRTGTSGPAAPAARPSAGGATVPPTVVGNDERGQRSDIYSDLTRDRTRSRVATGPEFDA